MKRIFCASLAILMLLCTLVGCATPDDTGESTTVQDTTAGVVAPVDTTTPDTTPQSNLPELDFGGQTVTILSRDHAWVKDEISVEKEQGDPINDAIYRRNIKVSELLHVTIKNEFLKGADNYGISETVRTAVKNQTSDFDAFVNSTYSTIMYTGEGLFANLRECEYIDFEQPWWSQGYNNLASIGNSQYFVSGATNLSLYRLIFVTFFNKTMFEAHNVPSLYDIVDANEWTIDKQMELVPLFYTENDGDGKLSLGDDLGFITNHDQIGVDAYWSSFDMPILKKNSENYYEYILDVDKVSSAVEKLNTLIYDTVGTYPYPKQSGDGEQALIAQKFASGGAAMTTLRLIEAESQNMRDMADKYGVVPMPKFSLEQEGYRSYAHDVITGFGIPTTNSEEDRFNMTGAVLEAMAYQSYLTVIPAYYEITLKAKFMDDEKSWEMLDIIVDNLYLDGGVFYTKELGSIHQQLRTLVGTKSTNTSSTLNAMKRPIELKLKTLMEKIKKLEQQ